MEVQQAVNTFQRLKLWQILLASGLTSLTLALTGSPFPTQMTEKHHDLAFIAAFGLIAVSILAWYLITYNPPKTTQIQLPESYDQKAFCMSVHEWMTFEDAVQLKTADDKLALKDARAKIKEMRTQRGMWEGDILFEIRDGVWWVMYKYAEAKTTMAVPGGN